MVHRSFLLQQRQQRGAVAVMVAGMLFVILAVCAMAIDLGLMYNRRVELHNLADAVALSTAAELDGTEAGVDRATDAAAAVAATFHYSYTKKIAWRSDAVQFSDKPARLGTWVSAAEARKFPDGRLFVRVDTTGLGTATGMVSTLFMNVLGASRDAVMQGVAIAGRTGIKVLPLGICAMSETAMNYRNTDAGKELVEFGFRRGVSYNLMNLNPKGTTPANYVINPFAPPGVPGTSGPTSAAIIRPYVCNGTMSMARVVGGNLTVVPGFPINLVYPELNSRFNLYDNSVCNRNVAPPDANIKAYDVVLYNFPWMATRPLAQSAAMAPSTERLVTIADTSPSPGGSTAAMYGPLWTYAKAAQWSAYVEGTPEPAAGYAGFSGDNWDKLYTPGGQKAVGYASVPYQASSGGTFDAPRTLIPRPPRNRRVLNVALLNCPDKDKTQVFSAAGVGKFFMTVPATDKALYAEFAGLVSDQSLSSSITLFP